LLHPSSLINAFRFIASDGLFSLCYSGVADAEAFPIPLGHPAALRSCPTL